MTRDALKLTIYFGETERHDGRLLGDRLNALYAVRGVRAAVLVRGIEGFGRRRGLHTERLESRSLDPPLVSVAVDAAERVLPLADEAAGLMGAGLLTLERARLLDGVPDGGGLPEADDDEVKLTVYLGRNERSRDGRRASRAVVEHLHRHGVAGATVLLGVDGVVDAARRRARLLSRNDDVPLMLIAVGRAAAVRAALPGLHGLLRRPVVTMERVEICRREGRDAGPPAPPPADEQHGLGVWQKLMVYSRPDARSGAEPLHEALVRRLEEAGAAGATTLRGIWGYSGDHPPHGDRLLAVRRGTPLLTVVVDEPRRIRELWPIVAATTGSAALVTAENVPALRAQTQDAVHGGTRLAAIVRPR